MKKKSNSIQRKVILLLQEASRECQTHFIEGVLFVWANRDTLGSLPLNQYYEKLIQLLICIDIPADVIISTAAKYEAEKDKGSLKGKSKLTQLYMNKMQHESLMCQFVYAYLLQNVHWHFTQNFDFKKTFNAAVKFIKRFAASRHPNTICWTLEIVNILTAKFSTSEAYKQDPKLKKEFNDIIVQLMTAMGQIITDEYAITYEKIHHLNFSIPPSVY